MEINAEAVLRRRVSRRGGHASGSALAVPGLSTVRMGGDGWKRRALVYSSRAQHTRYVRIASVLHIAQPLHVRCAEVPVGRAPPRLLEHVGHLMGEEPLPIASVGAVGSVFKKDVRAGREGPCVLVPCRRGSCGVGVETDAPEVCPEARFQILANRRRQGAAQAGGDRRRCRGGWREVTCEVGAALDQTECDLLSLSFVGVWHLPSVESGMVAGSVAYT